MQFDSVVFLVFFPIVFVLYYLVARWHTVQNLQNADCSSHGYWGIGVYPNSWATYVDSNNNPILVAMDIEALYPTFQEILFFDNAFYGTTNNTMTMFVSPTVVMYDTNPGNCCIGGFHTAQQGVSNPAGISVWLARAVTRTSPTAPVKSAGRSARRRRSSTLNVSGSLATTNGSHFPLPPVDT